MPTSALIITVILIAAALAVYLRKRSQMKKDVSSGKDAYKVPLSDDVQRIYYDNYEKEMKKLKDEEAREKQEASDAAASEGSGQQEDKN